MAVRLSKGGAYSSDIVKLRKLVRANGSVANFSNIVVTHQDHAGTQVTMIMNLAFQPNSNSAQPNASLYILGFTNANGTYTFNIAPWPGAAIGGAVALVANGSYASLGHAINLPQITNANLGQAVMDMAAYAGGGMTAAEQTGLARLLIAISEAVRFDAVADGVAAALAGTPYNPPSATIHAWGGRMIGS